MTQIAEQHHVPVDSIDVEEGFNVRATANGDADFIESVKTLGVIVPLLVKPSDTEGRYTLTSGHRRFHAAQEAKLDTVPVTLDAGDAERREQVAAVENIARQDLNAVEEADAVTRLKAAGLTEKGIRQSLGVTADWLKKRKLILALPESGRQAILDDHLTWQGIEVLAKAAMASPQLVDATVAMFDDDGHRTGLWRIDSHQVQRAAAVAGGGHVFPAEGGTHQRIPVPEVEGMTAEQRKKLDELTLPMPDYMGDKGDVYYSWPDWTDEDLDAFRAAGALWEDGDPSDRWDYRVVITDRAMWLDRLDDALVRLEKDVADAKKTSAALRPGGSESNRAAGDESADAEADKKAKRKAAREEVKALQAKAHQSNLALGRNLMNELASVKLDGDVATLLCGLAVREEGGLYGASIEQLTIVELGGGCRYVFEEWQKTVEKGKAKKKVVEYPDTEQSRRRVKKHLAGGHNPNEQVGRLIVALAACHYSIDRVVARSHRWGSGRVSAMCDTKALERVAKKALPRGHTALAKKLAAAEQKVSDLR